MARVDSYACHGLEEFLFWVSHRQGESQGCRGTSLWEAVPGNDLNGFALVRAEDVSHGESEPLPNWGQEVGKPFL